MNIFTLFKKKEVKPHYHVKILALTTGIPTLDCSLEDFLKTNVGGLHGLFSMLGTNAEFIIERVK